MRPVAEPLLFEGDYARPVLTETPPMKSRPGVGTTASSSASSSASSQLRQFAALTGMPPGWREDLYLAEPSGIARHRK
eukprot:7978123-Pyramimonas_sp.AAC.2